MVVLTWYRVKSGRWLLKAANGEIWAAVTPYRAGPKNHYKGTSLKPSLGSYSAPRDTLYWTTGHGVAAAKRNIVNWLDRKSWDAFTVA